MQLASPTVRPAEDTRDQPDLPAVGRPRRSPSRRSNHWATRNPDDFVRYPRLTPLGYLEESKLIARAQAGDIAARNAVWMHYARLTLSVVNSFRVPDHLLADAVQEGCIGLARAIEKFEIGRFNSFSTYAWHWIYNCIQRFLVENVLLLRLPSYLFPEYVRFRRELRGCRMPEEEAALADRRRRESPRLYHRLIRAHAAAEAVPLHLIDRREHPPTPAAEYHETPDWKALSLEALRGLAERERIVIVKRYGLFGCPALTLREVGEEMHLTRERVRQIQAEAEEKLRRRCRRLRHLFAEIDPDEAREE